VLLHDGWLFELLGRLGSGGEVVEPGWFCELQTYIRE